MINIYIGNLPYATSADDLAELFSAHGEVIKSAIVFDRETGRSRGFGFVEMEDRASGLQAIEQLAGQEFNGRPLTINEARPRGSGKGNYASASSVPAGKPASQSGGYRRYDRSGGPPAPSSAGVPQPEGEPAGYTSGYSNERDDDE